MRNWIKPIMVVLLAISIGGGLASIEACTAHKQPNSSGVTQPVSTQEQINSDNAQISVHNQAIAKSIIAINDAGFLEKQYFDNLTAGQIKITRIHQQLTPLLANPSPTNATQIKDLLTQMQSIAKDMVANGAAGVKNPNSQSQITDEINAVGTLAGTLISTLTTAGILK